MRLRHLAICAAMLLGGAAVAATSAHALTMQECSAKYKAAKEAGTLNGMKWNEFRKAQCGAEATPTPAATPAAETKPAPAPAAKPAETPKAGETKPASPGRQAMIARERACGKEWREAKAAGKIEAGMKWPQYWHECNKRKKAEGM